LIVRRTRSLGAHAEPWPDWRHFCFITNRDEHITIVAAEHREHAVVEQVIADLKDQALADIARQAAHRPSSAPPRPNHATQRPDRWIRA
jgi:hypothetical protein